MIISSYTSFAQQNHPNPQRIAIAEYEGSLFPQTIEEFNTEFSGGEEVMYPLIFRNAAKNWPVMKVTLEELNNEFGSNPIDVELNWNTKRSGKQKTTLKEHIKDMTCNFKNSGYYLGYVSSFEKNLLLDPTQTMCNQTYRPDLEQIEFLSMNRDIPKKLSSLSQFPKSESAGFVAFLGGHTVTHLHKHAAVFLLQIFGKKNVLLIPPSFSAQVKDPELSSKTGEGFDNYVDLENIDLNKHPKFKGTMIFSGQLSEGDILFIPNNWYHYISSTGTSISLSQFLLKYKKNKPENISLEKNEDYFEEVTHASSDYINASECASYSEWSLCHIDLITDDMPNIWEDLAKKIGHSFEEKSLIDLYEAIKFFRNLAGSDSTSSKEKRNLDFMMIKLYSSILEIAYSDYSQEWNYLKKSAFAGTYFFAKQALIQRLSLTVNSMNLSNEKDHLNFKRLNQFYLHYDRSIN